MQVMTIKQAAARPDCPLKEYAIRHYVKLHAIPHFKRGNRVYVDYDGLIEWAEKRMRESMGA